MNILIESYAKKGHDLIVKLKNGREITLPYSKNIEKRLLDLFIFNRNINYIISQEKKLNYINNIDVFGKMAIIDTGMIYSFLNGNMPGIMLFFLLVFVTTYADGKVAWNDEEFEERANYLKSLYYQQEGKIINKLDQKQEKNMNLNNVNAYNEDNIKLFENASKRFDDLVQKGFAKHREPQILSLKNDNYEISDDYLTNENVKKKERKR